MKVLIVYPVPFDNWDEFEPAVRRFTNSFKACPPGCDYTLVAVGTWGEPTDDVRRMFYGIKTVWQPAYDNLYDSGCWQQVAQRVPEPQDTFLVCFTSRVWFHRAGWLNHLVSARQDLGSGLYSTSASQEGGRMHLCLRAFGVDARYLISYPERLDDRSKGWGFETGKFADLVVREGGETHAVYWSGWYPWARAQAPDNIFRRGDQSNLLVFDRHSDLYAQADPEEKQRLERLTYG